MIVPRCERRGCQTPLNPRQGRFCSRACAGIGARRIPDADCARCGRALTRSQLKSRQRFCSVACSRVGQRRANVRTAILAVFRANLTSWLTHSDLAFWVYGDATPLTMQAIRQALTRIRQAGHVIESRQAPWEVFDSGPRRAYRLVEVARWEVAA